MSTKKVIELLAESEESWEASAQMAVSDASETLRGVASIYIKGNGGQGRGRADHPLPGQCEGDVRDRRDLIAACIGVGAVVVGPGPSRSATGSTPCNTPIR